MCSRLPLARSTLLLAAIAGSACGNSVTAPPPGDPPPSIEGILVAGATSAVFRVTATPSDPEVPAGPLPPDAVALRVIAESGGAAPLEPIADSAGYYRAGIAVGAGARYRLTGHVGGIVVEGVTVVPGPLALDAGPDPVELRLGRIATVPFRWRAPGATALATAEGYFVAGGPSRFTRDSVATLALEPPTGPADTAIALRALDPATERWLADPDRAVGNLSGAVGLVGGVAIARVRIRWR